MRRCFQRFKFLDIVRKLRLILFKLDLYLFQRRRCVIDRFDGAEEGVVLRGAYVDPMVSTVYARKREGGKG